MAITMAVMAAAQAVSSYAQQSREASAAQAYQDEQNRQRVKSTRDQYSQMSYTEVDNLQRSQQDGMDAQVSALQAGARVNLAAAASGTGGMAVDDMLLDVSRQKGENVTQIAMNRAADAYNTRAQAESIRVGNTLDTRRISKPSALQGVVNVSSATAQGYASGSQLSRLRQEASLANGTGLSGGA